MTTPPITPPITRPITVPATVPATAPLGSGAGAQVRTSHDPLHPYLAFTAHPVTPVQLPDRHRGLVGTWYPRSPDRGDRHPRTSALETGLLTLTAPDRAVDFTGRRPLADVEAYMRVEYTTDELVQACFHRPLAFAVRRHGWAVDLDPPSDHPGASLWAALNISASQARNPNPHLDALRAKLRAEVDREDPRVRRWVNVHRYARLTPASMRGSGDPSWRLGREQCPTDDAVYEADLCSVEERLGLREQQQRWRRWADQPFVAFSQVADSLQGTGLGRSLYLTAAAVLGTQGRTLRASGCLSDQAAALWRRFETDSSATLGTVTLPHPADPAQSDTFRTLRVSTSL